MKVSETKSFLEDICCSRNIPFVDHTIINVKYNINHKGLHLTPKGTEVVTDNILDIIDSLGE